MNRTTSIIVGIVVLALVVAGAYAISRSGTNSSSSSYPAQSANSGTQTNTSGANSAEGSDGSRSSSSESPKTVTVTYNGTAFSPKSETIAKGDTVKFVNNSNGNVWVGSNPHPIHTGYPTTGGCIGSTFDSCAGIPSGGSYSFQFNAVGTWGYHNHFNPSQGGSVVVK